MSKGDRQLSKKAVITGYGLINNLGLNTDFIWKNYQNKYFNKNLSIAMKVNNYNPESFFDKKSLKRLDSFTQYALISSNEAIRQAKLNRLTKELIEEIGVLIGVSGNGGDQALLDNHKVLLEKGPTRVSPYYSSTTMINSPPAEIALRNGFKGHSATVVAGEASSLLSIGNSLRKIREGECPIMIAGGTQGDITLLTANGDKQIRTSKSTIQNNNFFALENKNSVLSPGAGTIVLEDYEVAIKRKASILGEVLGFGMNMCGENLTKSYADAMLLAVQDAGISINDIDIVCIQESGITEFAVAEQAAIKSITSNPSLHVISTKRITGNLLAANGITQTVLSLLTMNYPPSRYSDFRNDKDKLGKPLGKIALINTFDYQGHNSCLIVKSV